MEYIQVQGGIPLQGKVRIQGSKNAALPVLAATLLTEGESRIGNCPKISDVYHMENLLRCLGCRVCRERGALRVDTAGVCVKLMPREAICSMRSSVFLLGALLGRCGEVILDYPGGCVIGKRPIDMHLSALEQMGARFRLTDTGVCGYTRGLYGADICLSFPSVGVTENIIMAAVTAKGDTVIRGAAAEPEICTLCDYLVCCGAGIEGAGTDKIHIHGVSSLHGADFSVDSDRIVAGTYLLACTGTGGACFLENAPVLQMGAVIHAAEQMGALCDLSDKGLYVQSMGKRPCINRLTTCVYPGFPTDLQSVALAVLCRNRQKCVVEEQIFENRFRVVPALSSMGADIRIADAHKAEIYGCERLHGAKVKAEELRGGAALVVAALMADGLSVIYGMEYIYRGYENICRDLQELGARIVSV